MRCYERTTKTNCEVTVHESCKQTVSTHSFSFRSCDAAAPSTVALTNSKKNCKRGTCFMSASALRKNLQARSEGPKI